MLKCSVVMTENPECCLPSDTVSTAAQIMRTQNVGSIPVIENKQMKKLIGIVTDRDLALQVVGNACDPRSTRVADVMTSPVITCHRDDDLQVALDTMAKKQLRRIPVVDDDLQIVGIISQADVATRIDHPDETARLVKEISQPPVEAEPYENMAHQGKADF